VTNKQRSGQTGDNWNRGTYGRRTGVQRLYEDEKYVDPHKTDMKFAAAEREKNLTTNGFRYSNGHKHSSGLGGYWGCIGPKLVHQPEYNVVKHGDKPSEVLHEPRQMVTNPPRKGYGATTPGVIFGPGPKPGESPLGRYGGKEFEHVPDPYDLARQKEMADRKAGAEMMEGRAPFRSVSHACDFFDGCKGVASSKIYSEDPRVPERKPKEPDFLPVTERAFFPSAAPKSGPLGTFAKFPKYMEDPLEEKMKLAKAAAAEAANVGAAPFKPTSKPHTTPTPSILFHTAGPNGS
jgi:hypothetical protein